MSIKKLADQNCIYCHGEGIRHNGYSEYPCNCTIGNNYTILPENYDIQFIKGKYIADLICKWANKKGIHPDDFDSLFVPELLEMLEVDN